MRTTLMFLPALACSLGVAGGAAGSQPPMDSMESSSAALPETAGDGGLTWGPSPPGLPAGARVAVVSGDPTRAGPFTLRVEMPPDSTVRPHHHPTSEELRLIEGTLHFGHGSKWDQQAMKGMAADTPVMLAAKKPHYLHAAGPVVLEVRGTGPFAITYIESKDDPRTGATP